MATTVIPTTLAPTTCAPAYSTDFSGVDELDDWTEYWKGEDFALTIEDAATDARVGTKNLRYTADADNTRKLASYDPPGSFSDGEILTLVNIGDLDGKDQGFRIFLRASGAEGSENGYFLNFYASVDNINLIKYVAGTPTSLYTETAGDRDFFVSSYPSWMRFQVIGTSIKFKMWRYDSHEPAEWQISVVDSDLSSGVAGLGGYTGSEVYDVMYWSVEVCDTISQEVPALTYGTLVDKLSTALMNALATSAINYCRLLPYPIPDSLNNKYLYKFDFYAATWNDNARIAIYKGSDATDLTDAVLVEDFGVVAGIVDNSHNEIELTTPELVSTDDVIYIVFKSNNADSQLIFSESPTSGQGQVANFLGRWDATADLGSDDTEAFPANLSAATNATQAAFWYSASVFFEDDLVTTIVPTTVAPTSLPPTTLAPTTTAPTTTAPTSLPPTSLEPTTLPPTSLAPTSLAPTTLPATTLPPTTSPPADGTVCWGHDTGVVEANIRDFTGNWSGTASIQGAGDTERLQFDSGENEESETWNIGPGRVKITIDKYSAGAGAPVVKYKSGASQVLCEADIWNAYVGSFITGGWVKVRIETV